MIQAQYRHLKPKGRQSEWRCRLSDLQAAGIECMELYIHELII